MEKNQLDINVKDSVFEPGAPTTNAKVHVRDDGTNRPLYKVWLYLEGNDLIYVDSVTYTLHETFDEPNRSVSRTASNPNCQLSIWTWGLFTVKATLVDKKGFTYSVSHELTYDKELPSQSNMYVHEQDDPNTNARPTLVAS